MKETYWIAHKPDGGLEVVTFNPVETESERNRYAELGWKWVEVTPVMDAWVVDLLPDTRCDMCGHWDNPCLLCSDRRDRLLGLSSPAGIRR